MGIHQWWTATGRDEEDALAPRTRRHHASSEVKKRIFGARIHKALSNRPFPGTSNCLSCERIGDPRISGVRAFALPNRSFPFTHRRRRMDENERCRDGACGGTVRYITSGQSHGSIISSCGRATRQNRARSRHPRLLRRRGACAQSLPERQVWTCDSSLVLGLFDSFNAIVKRRRSEAEQEDARCNAMHACRKRGQPG